jgi:hypothetical protein
MAATGKVLRRDLNNGARFMVGPIGTKIQPGDIIEVTHTVPNWTQQEKRVTRKESIGLGSRDDTLYRLTVEDYDSSAYTDVEVVNDLLPGVTLPTVTLSVDTLSNGSVLLTWTETGGTVGTRGWGIFRHTASHSDDPSLENRVGSKPVNPLLTMLSHGIGGIRRFIYNATDDEFGQTLYFVVRANIPPHGSVLSNEVTAVPVDTDPTGVVGSPHNLWFGGDFNLSDRYTETDGGESVEMASSNVIASLTGLDFTFDNPNNAHVDDANAASKTLDSTNSSADIAGTKYSFTGGVSRTGRVKVSVAGSVNSSVGSVELRGTYSISGGSARPRFSDTRNCRGPRSTRTRSPSIPRTWT